MLIMLILSSALVTIGKSVGVGYLSLATLITCFLISFRRIVYIIKEELYLFLALAIYYLILDILIFGFKDGLTFFFCGVAGYSAIAAIDPVRLN